MNALTAQIIGLVLLFLVTTGVALLPVVVLVKRFGRTYSPDQGLESPSLQLALSVANSLASGVFMEICFLGLFPEVSELFSELWQELKSPIDYPVGETIIIVGFFVVLALEQLVTKYQSKDKIYDKPSINSKEKTLNQDFPRQVGLKTISIQNITEEIARQAKLDEENDGDSGDTDNAAESTSSSTATAPADSYPDRSDSGLKTHPSHNITTPYHDHSDHASHPHSHGSALLGGHGAPSISSIGHRRFLMLLAAISVHSLLEGVAVGLQQSATAVVKLFTAILVHEVLVALAIGIKLASQHRHQLQGMSQQEQLQRRRKILCSSARLVCVFTAMVPVGIALGVGLGTLQGAAGFAVSGVCQALAAGVFLHVTFMELVPEELQRSHHPFVSIFCMLAGFLGMSVVSHYLE